MDKECKKADEDLAKQTEKKIVEAKKFLHGHGLSPNIYYLLSTVGAVYLEDFGEIDDALIAEIENHVRSPSFQAGDLSKSERIKYFGCNLKEPSSFAFTFLDKRKLKKISEDIRQLSQEASTSNMTITGESSSESTMS